jgi:hypothetical protein
MAAAGAPARESAGVWKGRSGPEGRARADASEDGWYGCACGAHARGGADCARARISPDGVRIRQAVACRLLATRTRAASSGGWHRPARAGPCVDDAGTPGRRRVSAMPSPHPQDGPPQARFHPHPDCRPALAGTRDRDFSGGWLGRSARQDVPQGHPFRLILLPAEPAGAPPPPSSRRTLRQPPEAFLPPGPIRFDPSGDGSGMSVARERGVWKKGANFGRWRGGHLLPLGGGECKIMTLASAKS